RLDAEREEVIRGIALQRADIDRPAFPCIAHAGPLAEDLRRADPCAGAAEDVLLQDRDGSTLHIVGRDLADESPDVAAGRARVDTGRVMAEVAAADIDQRLGPIEWGFDIAEIGMILGRCQAARGDIRSGIRGAGGPGRRLTHARSLFEGPATCRLARPV